MVFFLCCKRAWVKITGVLWADKSVKWAEHLGEMAGNEWAPFLCTEFLPTLGPPPSYPGQSHWNCRECETLSVRPTVVYTLSTLTRKTTRGTKSWRIWPMGKFTWNNGFLWVCKTPLRAQRWELQCLRVTLGFNDSQTCPVWISISQLVSAFQNQH